MDKLMKLDIQMFAETAENETEVDETEVEDVDSTNTVDETDTEVETVTEVADGEEDEKKARTKAYSERLNKEREKIRQEVETEHKNKLNAIAKARNFDSWEELEEYDEQERLRTMGIEDGPEFKTFLNELITKNPIVKEAQAILIKQKEQDKENFLKEQIKLISQIDKSIVTLDDLVKLDRYDEFAKKIDKGYDLVDAYKITYFDKIKTNNIETAKQTVLNNIDSKSHLKSVSGAAGKEIHVPDDIMAMYKKNVPGMSEADIRKHYAKTIGGNE